ncbi:MAG: hypothetical protein PXY39_12850 [archaeon]|nr:hypothetical protein [archaeon]
MQEKEFQDVLTYITTNENANFKDFLEWKRRNRLQMTNNQREIIEAIAIYNKPVGTLVSKAILHIAINKQIKGRLQSLAKNIGILKREKYGLFSIQKTAEEIRAILEANGMRKENGSTSEFSYVNNDPFAVERSPPQELRDMTREILARQPRKTVRA